MEVDGENGPAKLKVKFGKGWMGKGAEIHRVNNLKGEPKGIMVLITISESTYPYDCCIETQKNKKDGICIGIPTEITRLYTHPDLLHRAERQEEAEEMDEIQREVGEISYEKEKRKAIGKEVKTVARQFQRRRKQTEADARKAIKDTKKWKSDITKEEKRRRKEVTDWKAEAQKWKKESQRLRRNAWPRERRAEENRRIPEGKWKGKKKFARLQLKVGDKLSKIWDRSMEILKPILAKHAIKKKVKKYVINPKGAYDPSYFLTTTKDEVKTEPRNVRMSLACEMVRSDPKTWEEVSTIAHFGSKNHKLIDKGLSDHGRRNTLVARLQQHASTSSSNNTATEAATIVDIANNSEQTPLVERRSVSHESSSENPLLNDAQLAQIQSIVAKTVEQSVNDIATNAARAAVQAMATAPTNEPQQTTGTELCPVLINHITPISTPRFQTFEPEAPHSSSQSLPASNHLPYGQSFHDLPASYVKKIQSGEFFELSKLLPKNLCNTVDEQPVVLTVENSIVKVKQSTQSTTNITDIDKWTTAFTTYMSVFTHQFPNRAQELLQYMTIIRHAAHCHKGVGWCIYDIKFRRKAGLSLSLNWSEIDQQLWLMTFAVPPASLREEYPLFHKGPQHYATPGNEQGGICRDFNRSGACKRAQCRYRHICNRCEGEHAGLYCTENESLQPYRKQGKVHSSSSQRHSNQDKR
ncbi:gag [Paramuricea clavata]|uniref:TPA_exp: gag n=1 Tax=Paramuricea clavata TaxID=317549 RepID=A0A7D9ECW5_PARCT|nr:gag [Paramuricea clavata]